MFVLLALRTAFFSVYVGHLVSIQLSIRKVCHPVDKKTLRSNQMNKFKIRSNG